MFDRRLQKLKHRLVRTNLSARTSGAAIACALFAAIVPTSAATAQTGRPTASASIADDMLSYQMKPGDHLYGLAEKYMVSMAAIAPVQRLNGIRDPFNIPVGTVIRIPVRLLKHRADTAKLVAWRGTVAVGKTGAPTVGMELREGVAIATGQGGFATLLLSNGSRVSIPSQSVVQIARLREYLINQALDYELAVVKGRVQTKAAPLKNPDSRYRIRTPIAVTAVRGTEFRVKVEEETAPSLTEVLEGNVAVASTATNAVTPVPHGEGLAVDKAGGSQAEKLLPAPELERPGKVQKDDTLQFTVKPLAGASRYHVVFATDASMTEQVGEAYSDNTEIAYPTLPNGRYFVRVSALSPNKFEGFATNYGFARRLTKVTPDASAPADDGSVLFKWDATGDGKMLHRFQLYRDTVESTPFIDEAGLTKSEIKLNALPPGTWLWRVGISAYSDGTVTESWSTPEKLIVAREE